jgi:hypoxanthine phosphoribosyltransferase
MDRLFVKPLVTQEELRTRIKELGKQISQDYQGKDLVVVGVLKGAYVFYADLVRAIRLPLHIDFLIAKTKEIEGSPGKFAKEWSDLTEPISKRHVLLVEEIVDSGITAKLLLEKLWIQHPASVEICSLLSKSGNRQADVPIRYVGFEVPATYVVGYGLDYQQKYRNLPYLAQINPELVKENG